MTRSMHALVTVIGALVAMGCGSDPEELPAAKPADPGAAGSMPDAPDAAAPAFEPFEIELGQSVSVGAFVLQLGAARVAPAEPVSEAVAAIFTAPFATVDVDFTARNASEGVATPLADLDTDGILLEVAGKFFFGEIEADPVPGLRDGEGSVSWVITNVVTAEELRQATITFGEANQNKAVVPFADGVATVTLADIPLVDRFVIAGYRKTTLDVRAARVQFNSRGDNIPLPAATAWLVLEGVLSADAEMDQYGERWSVEDVFLTRPDGVSVAPDRLNNAIYPGDREDVELVFELEMPVAGSYTFGVTDADTPTVTREIVIP